MGPTLGIFLESISTLFEEISCSVGKKQSSDGKASIFMMGLVQHFMAAVFLGMVILLGFDQLRFNWESLPTLLVKCILDVFQVHFTLLAIEKADRTEFSFVKMLTIPLLLVVDFTLGYFIDSIQLIAMILLGGIFTYIFTRSSISKKGLDLVLFSAINPVLTISIYKYHITYFNSVATEQLIAYSIITIYVFLMVRFRTREKVLNYISRPVALVHALSTGIAGLLTSYSYLFAAPSVITTAKRAASILWSSLSGIVYFKEDHKREKLFLAFLLIFVLVMLAL